MRIARYTRRSFSANLSGVLQRRAESNKLVYYTSPLLEKIGVPHAFSTRLGGKSPPPFDSLNMGNPNGCDLQDDYGRIYDNYALLQEAIGVTGRQRCWVHQVHGGTVIDIPHGQHFQSGPKADAMTSDDASLVLSVRVADCVPVLLTTDDGRHVAAVHAGWRGIIAGVVPAAAKTLLESGSMIVAAIGPCISKDAYEVGPEVLEQFDSAFGAEAPATRRSDGKGHVDLREAVRMQLLKLGITPDRIDSTDRCTFRDKDEFFSHRRENGITGRMAALISAR